MTHYRRLFPLFIALFTVTACVSTVPPDREDWRHNNVVEAYPLRAQTEWVAHSGEWRIAAQNGYMQALKYVEKEAKQREPGSWAVVLDVDETVLSNVEYHIALDRSASKFTPGSWRDWVEERSAAPVPDAFTFMHRVQDIGGEVAFVTNRMDYEKAATIDNLSMYGLVYGRDYNVIFTRSYPEGGAQKDVRFAEVERLLSKNKHHSVRTIAYIGDQVGDKPVALGNARFFCIPQGGLYGEPCEQEKKPAIH